MSSCYKANTNRKLRKAYGQLAVKLTLFAAVFAVGAGAGMAALILWLYIKRIQAPRSCWSLHSQMQESAIK